MTDRSGTTLNDRFVVGARLAVNEALEIYDAEEPRAERTVMVVFFRGQENASESVLRAFEDQARVLLALSHPGIAPLHSFGVHEKIPYIVTTPAEAPTLQDVIARDGPLTASRAIRVLGAMVDAVEHMHRMRLSHGGLRLSSFEVTEGGVRLADLAIKSLVGTLRPGGTPFSPSADLKGIEVMARSLFEHHGDTKTIEPIPAPEPIAVAPVIEEPKRIEPHALLPKPDLGSRVGKAAPPLDPSRSSPSAAPVQPVFVSSTAMQPLPKLTRELRRPQPRLESLVEAEDPAKLEPFLPAYMIWVNKVRRQVQDYIRQRGRSPALDLAMEAAPMRAHQESRAVLTGEVLVPSYVTTLQRWLGSVTGQRKSFDGFSPRSQGRSGQLMIYCGVAMFALLIMLGVSSPTRKNDPVSRIAEAGMLPTPTRAQQAPSAATDRSPIVIHATREASESPAPVKKKKHR
jgi:hypothetical protein